jgi:GT2 family glycosyltransferase
MATKVFDLEISGEINPFFIEEKYNSCYILIRYHKRLIGWIWITEFQNGFVTKEQIIAALNHKLSWNLIQEFLGRSLELNNCSVNTNEPISVVVCTRNRTEQLRGCLEALLALEYSTFEIIIVDNAPGNDDTYNLVSHYPVRYVREERPGLDWARNRGINESKYNLVAFTDDDARADPYWLQFIAKAFLNPKVMCVTGYVAPAELDTWAQQLFEFSYGGMGHGLKRRVISLESLTKTQILWASSFGVGANMAFRRNVFEKIGLFDIALDVGTPSHGAGDIEMFHRLVTSGYLLVYEPSMLIWHIHRLTMPGLRKQVYDNGRSFGCYLIKCWVENRLSRSTIIKFFLFDWLYKWNLKNIIKPPGQLQRSLCLSETIGMAISPLAYTKSRKWAKKIVDTYDPENKNPKFIN